MESTIMIPKLKGYAAEMTEANIAILARAIWASKSSGFCRTRSIINSSRVGAAGTVPVAEADAGAGAAAGCATAG